MFDVTTVRQVKHADQDQHDQGCALHDCFSGVADLIADLTGNSN
jgi:hypothetical protein